MSTRTIDSTELENIKSDTWVNGVKKSMVKEYCASAVVANGSAVFYLTDNGTSGGNAVFNNVYKESANFWVDNSSAQYQMGGYTLSEDKKSITISVGALGSVIIGIIQFVNATNGVTIYLRIKGD